MTDPTTRDRFVSRDGQFRIGGLTDEQKELIAERRRRGGRRSARQRAVKVDLPPLGELRNALGLTQAELGERIGTSQKGISKLERQDDLLLSTLALYLDSLGAHLELVIDDQRIPIAVRTTDAGEA
jgi:DNA-binding XRE family transcriptional regulator